MKRWWAEPDPLLAACCIVLKGVVCLLWKMIAKDQDFCLLWIESNEKIISMCSVYLRGIHSTLALDMYDVWRFLCILSLDDIKEDRWLKPLNVKQVCF